MLEATELEGRVATGSSRRVLGLRCRACGYQRPTAATHVCEMCFGPLEVDYDYQAVAAAVSREQIASGPPSIWRYRALLPYEDEAPPVTLGEGMTPLVHARRLGAQLGLRNLYLKNDSLNPTNSFKDRVVSVAISWARSNGFKIVGCASTGNLANSLAAYAAHAGLQALVVIPDDLEANKVALTRAFAPRLVRVSGTYDQVNRLCSELADTEDWGFCNINLRPFYSEGSKTLTFETVEQLGWRVPDDIVVPIGSGCQFVKHRKAIGELISLGLVAEEKWPRLHGAQAAGCGPVAAAWAAGRDDIEPVREPNTVAKSIAIGNPSDGRDVLRIARETGGVVWAASEEEISAAIDLLARTEGIFTETAGGVTVAVLSRLARSGRWHGDETVVAYITGHGLKTIELLGAEPAHPLSIRPNLGAFRSAHPDLYHQ